MRNQNSFYLLALFPSIIAAQKASKFDSIILNTSVFYTCADITIPPRAVNVSISGAAEFTCTAIATAFIWEANRVGIDEGNEIAVTTIVLNKAQDLRMSTLRIVVSSSSYNAVNITCIAVSLSPFTSEESDPALLLVQGYVITLLWMS